MSKEGDEHGGGEAHESPKMRRSIKHLSNVEEAAEEVEVDHHQKKKRSTFLKVPHFHRHKSHSNGTLRSSNNSSVNKSRDTMSHLGDGTSMEETGFHEPSKTDATSVSRINSYDSNATRGDQASTSMTGSQASVNSMVVPAQIHSRFSISKAEPGRSLSTDLQVSKSNTLPNAVADSSNPIPSLTFTFEDHDKEAIGERGNFDGVSSVPSINVSLPSPK